MQLDNYIFKLPPKIFSSQKPKPKYYIDFTDPISRLAAAKLALYEEEARFKQRLGLYSFHFCLSSP